jgi:hypothetical protein
MYAAALYLITVVMLTRSAEMQDPTTSVTSLATTTTSASANADITTSATQVSITITSLISTPISITPGSTLKTSTRSAGVSQTSTSSDSASQNNSSSGDSPDREASHNGLSVAAKVAIAIVVLLAVSAAVFLAFWLGKRQSRKAAANVKEAKPDPEEIVPGGNIEKDDDNSSNISGSTEILGLSALDKPCEMGATSSTPPGKAVPVITPVELSDDNAAAEQRPITTTQHMLTRANAERQAQLVAACDRMQRKLDVARNRRSGIVGGVVELEDRRRSLTPAPRAELTDQDGPVEPRIVSRIVDVDVGVPVELMGNERFEKG